MEKLTLEADAKAGVAAPSVAVPAPAPVRAPLARRALSSRRLSTALIYATSVAIAIALWQYLSHWYDLPTLYPPATETFEHFWRLLKDGTLIDASVVSLARILAGFGIGSLAGVTLGLLMGRSAVVRSLAEPYVHFFRFVPPLAWFGPVLLWFGSGESAKVLLIVYTTIFIVALNTMAGVIAVPPNKIRMAAAFGARGPQMFFLVVLPASAPYIFSGMRIAMGNSFMTVVAAEMLAATEGLGFLVNSGLLFLQITTVFAAILALGVLGFATDRVFQLLIRRFGGRFTAGLGEAR